MQKLTSIFLTGAATLLLALGTTLPSAPVLAQDDDDFTPASCKDKANPPKEKAEQGYCLVIDRKKGNCMGCHLIQGMSSGNIAPPLVNMKARYPDKDKLRAQIADPYKANPDSVMPPFEKHKILSGEEIDKITEYVWSKL